MYFFIDSLHNIVYLYNIICDSFDSKLSHNDEYNDKKNCA